MKKVNDSLVKVWDPALRVFHWSLVLLFLVALLSGEDAQGLHVPVGYIIAALMIFRLAWGFIGPKHARFSDFIRGPGAVMNYLKGLFYGRAKHYMGHNPAGGLMVLVLLVSISLTALSGMKTYGEHTQDGHEAAAISLVGTAHADEADEDGYARNEESHAAEYWEEIHEVMAFFTLFLIGVHIAGVVVTSLLHRENLIKSMVTGTKTRMLL